MTQYIAPVIAGCLLAAFLILIFFTVKVTKATMNQKRADRARQKKENIKLRAIGCAKNYWYNKQDVEDRPEGRPKESYYHYFNDVEDCIQDLIVEMYDCGLVRTEVLQSIANSGGVMGKGKEAKAYVQNLHNKNVVSAKEEKAALKKAGMKTENIQIPVVDWDLEDLLKEKLAEAQKREQQEADVANEVLREAERALNKEVRDKAIPNIRPEKRRSDSRKTAELGKARLEADKRNRKLKEQFEAEEEAFLTAELPQLPIEEEKTSGDPEVAKKVSQALDENDAKRLSKETKDMAEEVLDDAQHELTEATKERKKKSKGEKVKPMSKQEKAEFERNILVQTAVYENWVSYVFQLYEMVEINATEEIRNLIRATLMEYGHNDVSVLLHSPK